jgi:hypothetical protein
MRPAQLCEDPAVRMGISMGVSKSGSARVTSFDLESGNCLQHANKRGPRSQVNALENARISGAFLVWCGRGTRARTPSAQREGELGSGLVFRE